MRRAAGFAVTAATGFVLTLIHPAPVQAAVVSALTNLSLSTTIPSVITVGNGVGQLSFTAAMADDGPGAAVTTGGTAQVTTIFGQVADYVPGTVFDGTASFATFTSPATIEFSAADDLIGFSYTATDGVHFGYAEVNGPTLVGYAYQSLASTSITAAPIASLVPEPASLVLLASAAAVVGGLGIRRRGLGRVGTASATAVA